MALTAEAVRPIGFRLDLMIKNLLPELKDLPVQEKCNVSIAYFSCHYTLNFPKLSTFVIRRNSK